MGVRQRNSISQLQLQTSLRDKLKATPQFPAELLELEAKASAQFKDTVSSIHSLIERSRFTPSSNNAHKRRRLSDSG